MVLPECLASLAAAVVSASCVSWSSHHNSKRKWAHVQMPSFHTQTWTHSQPSLSSSLLLSPKKYIAFFLDFFFFIIFLSLLNHLPVGRQQFIGRHRDISTGTWLHTRRRRRWVLPLLLQRPTRKHSSRRDLSTITWSLFMIMTLRVSLSLSLSKDKTKNKKTWK